MGFGVCAALVDSDYLDLESETCAVPIGCVKEVRDFLPYASPVRVMFEFLFLTGCRLKELDGVSVDFFVRDYVFIRLGKNQRGYRKVRLPAWFIEEVRHYRNEHRCFGSKLFGISSETLQRYFNRDVRPKLSKEWRKVTFKPQKKIMRVEHVLQLKGLRKTFTTLRYHKHLMEMGSHDMAAEGARRDLQHSSKSITYNSYITDAKRVGVTRYYAQEPAQALRANAQEKLLRFIK